FCVRESCQRPDQRPEAVQSWKTQASLKGSSMQMVGVAAAVALLARQSQLRRSPRACPGKTLVRCGATPIAKQLVPAGSELSWASTISQRLLAAFRHCSQSVMNQSSWIGEPWLSEKVAPRRVKIQGKSASSAEQPDDAQGSGTDSS
ncbi:unnamed protein product, partial [Polarella glacialis]